MKIKIKYFDGTPEIQDIPQGDWIDIAVPNKVVLTGNKFKLVHLGFAAELPKGYEAHIIPRSSTFVRYGCIMPNSMGLIDESYAGNDDEWLLPLYVLENRAAFIPAGSRIAQFRIAQKQPKLEFEAVQDLTKKSRGGVGSTGV